jgi:DNA-directed RNA polymerase specialized sigma24 family protein
MVSVMGAPDAAVRIDDLLAHREWVRGLAVALARDPSEADDLEQETWLSALRSPPRPDVPARGWLTTVVRNAMRQRSRADARRSQKVWTN